MYSIEEFDNLKTKVLKYIIFKKRTVQEIKRKFSEIENKELLEDVIEELKENGYINDENYIQRAINEYTNINNLSIKEIKYKLLTKGISNSLIEDYIFNHIDELEEYELKSAIKIVMKKQPTMEQEKIKQLLAKKGYKQDNIEKALEDNMQEWK